MNNSLSTMTTLINNLPVKNTQVSDDDINDPQVQDVLKEFEEELTATKNPIKNNTNNVMPLQQPIQPSMQIQQPIINHQLPFQKRLDIIDYDIVKKSLYILILIAFIFHPTIFTSIISKLPEYILKYTNPYEFYIKLLIIFINIYLLYFYNVA